MGNKKVVVGMSGGIDSSVAALLLKQQGYEVIGVTLKHLPDELSENPGKTCCSLDDINDARYTCYKLDIPHYVINVVEEFKKEVMNYFVQMYNSGKTPSPCIICDEKVKIKKLVDFANKMGIKYIATGHYSKKSMNGLLMWDKENRKDQSYMLYRLEKDVVNRFLFPLSEYEKVKVREIAKENGIHTHNKPDSQGICFAPNGYIPYLQKVLGNDVKKGNFIDKNGKIIGEHIGYQFYTIGQRRGLGLNLGKPFFVLEIRPETNEIVVGDFEELLIEKIEVINCKFHYDLEKIVEKELIARPRFSSKGLKGKLIIESVEISKFSNKLSDICGEKINREIENKMIRSFENNNHNIGNKEDSSLNNNIKKVYFQFEEKTHENSEGQHIVFYLDNELIGGGEIKGI